MAITKIKEHVLKMRVKIRTSIGGNARPTNKSKRRAFKPYRGQGRTR